MSRPSMHIRTMYAYAPTPAGRSSTRHWNLKSASIEPHGSGSGNDIQKYAGKDSQVRMRSCGLCTSLVVSTFHVIRAFVQLEKHKHVDDDGPPADCHALLLAEIARCLGLFLPLQSRYNPPKVEKISYGLRLAVRLRAAQSTGRKCLSEATPERDPADAVGFLVW